MPPRKIIIDTDPGQDDAFAILLAVGSPELEVVAVTEIRASRKLAPLLGCPTGARWTQVSALRRLRDADAPLFKREVAGLVDGPMPWET